MQFIFEKNIIYPFFCILGYFCLVKNVQIINGHVITSMTVESLVDCTFLCNLHEQCNAFRLIVQITHKIQTLMLVMTILRLAENEKSFDKYLEFVYKSYNISVTLVSKSYILLYNEQFICYLSIHFV